MDLKNINQNAIKFEYAVRGPIVIRAKEIENELASGVKKPFKEIIRSNIGDCHATGQKPLTFLRQVLACASDDSLLNQNIYPADVKAKVQEFLSYCGGRSVGAYSDSSGVEIVKQHIAQFIEDRDGYKSDPADIFLSTGASEAIRSILALINQPTSKPIGVMIPIPQYPLYSGTIVEYGMSPINYLLDEDNEWALNINDLDKALHEARKTSIPKAIVVINPGNPTGSVLTRKNIEDIVKFAQKERLVILADEVYQHNIYDEAAEFVSFKKVVKELGADVELASFFSVSKGFMGECGLRGGFCEMTNFTPEVRAVVLKMLSVRLCSSILGQLAMDCIVAPPKPGDASYALFEKEKNDVLAALKYRAGLVAKTFNQIDGFKSNKVAGAMYSFPRLEIPDKAIQKAKSLGVSPDFLFAQEFLDNAGICVVPGSGFGQKEGTYHFRMTILPQNEQIETMMKTLKVFYNDFRSRYA